MAKRIDTSGATFLVAIGMVLMSWVCGSDEEATKPASSPLTVIKISQGAWLASEINTAISKILLPEQMGVEVEVTTNRDEYDQWMRISRGEEHACLEIWESGPVPLAPP